MNLRWRKSSYSGGGGTGSGECVELADLGSGVGVRDSQDPEGPKLALNQASFAALVGKIKRNDLNLS